MIVSGNAAWGSIFGSVLVFSLLFSCGCGGGDKASVLFDSINQSNVQTLANLYNVFQSAHEFKGPKDEQQFKDYIASMPPSYLKNYNVDVSKIDELFISERDQQPFKIRWGLKASSRQGLVPLVFESKGVDGKYMIGFSSFVTKEVDQAEYDAYLSGKRDGEIPEGQNRESPAQG